MAKEKKKRKWIIIVCVAIVVIIAIALGAGGESDDDSSADNTVTVEQTADTTQATTQTTTAETTSGATLGEINALQKAESYLRMGGFSKQSLKDQLEFEGFEKVKLIMLFQIAMPTGKSNVLKKRTVILRWAVSQGQVCMTSLNMRALQKNKLIML